MLSSDCGDGERDSPASEPSGGSLAHRNNDACDDSVVTQNHDGMNEEGAKLLQTLDDDREIVSKVELIRAIKANEELESVFQIPAHVHQEGGSRDDFMKIIKEVDLGDTGNMSPRELIDCHTSFLAQRDQVPRKALTEPLSKTNSMYEYTQIDDRATASDVISTEEDSVTDKNLTSAFFNIPSKLISFLAPTTASTERIDDVEAPSTVPTPNPSLLCQLCSQLKFRSDGIAFAACLKKHTFCRPCLAIYVNVQLENEIGDQPCPLIHEGCDAVASEEEIRSMVYPENQNFLRKLNLGEYKPNSASSPLRGKQRARDGVAQCPACMVWVAGGRAGNKKFPIIKCRCGETFCFYHLQLHPPTERCFDFATQAVASTENTVSGRLKTDDLSRKCCPGCKVENRKLDNFNSIYCSWCRECWCWLCERQADSNHYKPWNLLNGCPGQESVDWETLRLSGSETLDKIEARRRSYGRTVFVLYLLYSLFKYTFIVVPISVMVIIGALASLPCIPLIFAYQYFDHEYISMGNNDINEDFALSTCPVPFTVRARLPFEKPIDVAFSITVYLSSCLLIFYSIGLFLIWAPIAMLALLVAMLNSAEQALFDVYIHLNDDAINFGCGNIVEFLVWPLGLPMYILCSIFESR